MTDDQNPKPAGYDGPVGGWGSMRGMAQVGLAAHPDPAVAATLSRQNKPGGYMCSSCAWAKPPNPHPAEFCENGAKATIWDLSTDRCTPEVLARHSVSDLAEWPDHDLEMLGRLTHPLRYDAATDRYVEASWDEAITATAAHLKSIDPKSACFYVSGKAALEPSFLFGLFARAYGHLNLPDSSNMCHETTSVGLKEVIGSPVGTCVLEDFEHCDAIFYIGQNPGTNSPRILHPLQKAVERGCAIVAFNPLREKGLLEFTNPQRPLQMTLGRSTKIADLYFQPNPGGDIAALTGVAKHVLAMEEDEGGILDHEFLAQHCHGLQDWMDWVAATDWEALEEVSGLSRAQMEAAGVVYARAKAVMGIYGMGLTQHVHGSDSIGALVNLMLLRGNIGRKGAGVSPVRGHSNVQGQRTVGITEKPDLTPHDKLRELFDIDPPEDEGWNTLAFCEALLRGEVSAFVGLGGNLARAVPDQKRIMQAWRNIPLTVHVATRLNRTLLAPGKQSWILPCLVRAETDLQQSGPQQVSVEDSFSHIYGSIGRRDPASPHLWSETAIVSWLAETVLPPNPRLTWRGWRDDYALIRKSIESVWPDEFGDYEKRMNQPGGFYRGNPARERDWQTDSGKAQFTVPAALDATGLSRGEGAPLRLITLRSNDQFNTTIYGMSDRLRGIDDRMVVMMSPEDMERLGLAADDRVSLVTETDDGMDRRVGGLRVVPYDLPHGAVAGYYPELNQLAPLDRFDLASGTPAYKGIPVRVEA